MSEDKPIYLDYNATTPIHEEVGKAMIPYLTGTFGNPSSSHIFGKEQKSAVLKSREQVSELLNCDISEIIFTSGGTESNNFALRGVFHALKEKYPNKNHVVTSAIEHPSIKEVCKYLKSEFGLKVTFVGVDKFGVLNLKELEEVVTENTLIVSIMHANNEVGTIQPIREVVDMCKKKGVLVHCDAAQSCGKVKIDVQEMGVDLLSLCSHKFYGPPGIGILYIREGTPIERMIHGATHERQLRAGTENVIHIVGIGKACELARIELDERAKKMKENVEILFETIKSELKKDEKTKKIEYVLNGHPTKKIPNTLSISFPGVEATEVLEHMEKYVAASAGAACHADSVTVSETLLAMGVEEKVSLGTLRLTVGIFTTKEDVLKAGKIIARTVRELSNPSMASAVTSSEFGMGCGCKLSPVQLETVLSQLDPVTDPRVLTKDSKYEDSGVFKVNDEVAVVQSTDFFTPMIDDPYVFGKIASANALSDLYCMGAVPVTAMNIACFPIKTMDLNVLKEILRGAQDKCKEANVSVIGGHTIVDHEIKFGQAVTGICHPEKYWDNSRAEVGDILYMTKGIGTALLSQGIRDGLVTEKDVIQTLKDTMEYLNKYPADILMEFSEGVHAVTDITGFGLIGHLMEILITSKVDAELVATKVPLIHKKVKALASLINPHGTDNNFKYVECHVSYQEGMSNVLKKVLNDPQTNGGLIFSVSPKIKEEVEKKFAEKKVMCIEVGKVIKKGSGIVNVVM